MYLNPTNPSEVKNIISNLKAKGSSGIDEIPSTVLKTTPNNVILALTQIFNLSFASGKFISVFKQAKIVTVFKKGCVTDVNNYGPISLLSVISKILEKLLYISVIFEPTNFFSETQFGNLVLGKITLLVMLLCLWLKK